MTESRANVFVLVALAYCAAASFVLAFLLWLYVPQQTAAFAALGLPLPLPPRLVILASLWFVRLLPFLVLAGIPLAVVALPVALWLFVKMRQLLGVLLMALGVALTLASILVVLAMRWPLVALARSAS